MLPILSPSTSHSPPTQDAASRVVVSRQSLESTVDALSDRFGRSTWAGLALHWAWSWAQCCPDRIEVEALVARRDDALVGFALVYRVMRLEVLRYLGPGGVRTSDWLRRRWRDPVTLHVAYVDIPYADEEAVWVAAEEPDGDAVRDALVREATADRRADAICVRTAPGGATDLAADRLSLRTVPMPPGTGLDLEGGYDAWLEGRSSTGRARLRKDRRTLERAGGRIVRIADPLPHAERLVALQHDTVEAALRAGGVEVPVPLRETFLEALAKLPEANRTIVAAEVDGRIVASLIVLIVEGDRAFVGPCGIDYAVSPRTRAYFCLWPEVVKLASEHGCRQVIFGSEAYENKLRLGATKLATQFRVAYGSWLLRLVAGPLTAALSEALGSEAQAPPAEASHD